MEFNNEINIKFIVITGGPGAGKTAVLEMIKKINLNNTTVLPEAASILFNGGFWRLPSKSALASAQRAIFHVQHEMETLVKEENKWNFALCDRGTLDGLAYWPYDEELFWKMNQTSLSEELSRYSAIIHLRTPTETQGYNNINPLRTENALTARGIDNKIADIWKDHPKYMAIESYDNFLTKTELAIELIKKVMI